MNKITAINTVKRMTGAYVYEHEENLYATFEINGHGAVVCVIFTGKTAQCGVASLENPAENSLDQFKAEDAYAQFVADVRMVRESGWNVKWARTEEEAEEMNARAERKN